MNPFHHGFDLAQLEVVPAGEADNHAGGPLQQFALPEQPVLGDSVGHGGGAALAGTVGTGKMAEAVASYRGRVASSSGKGSVTLRAKKTRGWASVGVVQLLHRFQAAILQKRQHQQDACFGRIELI